MKYTPRAEERGVNYCDGRLAGWRYEVHTNFLVRPIFHKTRLSAQLANIKAIQLMHPFMAHTVQF